MHKPDIAVTENAEPVPVVVVQCAPLSATAAGQRRLGRTTALDLVISPFIGRCGPSRTCVIT